MKGSKLLMILLTTLMTLAFIVTTVGAQGQVPQVGEVDEDGDLVVDIFPQLNVSAAPTLPDLAGMVDLGARDGEISVDSVPIYPDLAYVYTKYPTFVFSKDAAALKYQVAVYDYSTSPAKLLYTFKGAPNCVVDQCALTPTTPLKAVVYPGYKGIYLWQVRSKTLLGWGGWSWLAIFGVLKTSFLSTFTTLDTKWIPMYGNWVVTSAGYAKTKGMMYTWSSLMEKHFAADNYVYEVMMKRKTVDDSGDISSANRIYFLADVTAGSANSLYDGYAFAYANDGYYSLWRRDDGAAVSLITWTYSAYINPEGWNKLTVMTDYPYIDLYINEHYLGYVYIADDPIVYRMGYVGVEMYEYYSPKSPLMVDWARLEYTTTFPYSFAMGADGLRDPAYELTTSVNGVSGSESSSR